MRKEARTVCHDKRDIMPACVIKVDLNFITRKLLSELIFNVCHVRKCNDGISAMMETICQHLKTLTYL